MTMAIRIAIIAFSRNERTHPFAGARNRDFLDCKLAAPVGFCRGFGPRFRVHLSSSFVASLVVFDFLGVSLKLTGF